MKTVCFVSSQFCRFHRVFLFHSLCRLPFILSPFFVLLSIPLNSLICVSIFFCLCSFSTPLRYAISAEMKTEKSTINMVCCSIWIFDMLLLTSFTAKSKAQREFVQLYVLLDRPAMYSSNIFRWLVIFLSFLLALFRCARCFLFLFLNLVFFPSPAWRFSVRFLVHFCAMLACRLF